jgi:hypothetical protein
LIPNKKRDDALRRKVDTKQKLVDTKQKLVDTEQKLIDTKQKLIDTKQKLIDPKLKLIDTKIEDIDSKSILLLLKKRTVSQALGFLSVKNWAYAIRPYIFNGYYSGANAIRPYD